MTERGQARYNKYGYVERLSPAKLATQWIDTFADFEQLPTVRIARNSKYDQLARITDVLQEASPENQMVATFAEGPNARTVALEIVYRIERDFLRNPLPNLKPHFYLTRVVNKIAVIIKLEKSE